jgi:hypothetical protein
MTTISWDDLVGRMRALAMEAESSLTEVEFRSVWDLIDVGEPGVGFELMCAQIYERDSAVSSVMAAEFHALGTAMGLEPEQWEVLRVEDS